MTQGSQPVQWLIPWTNEPFWMTSLPFKSKSWGYKQIYCIKKKKKTLTLDPHLKIKKNKIKQVRWGIFYLALPFFSSLNCGEKKIEKWSWTINYKIVHIPLFGIMI